MAKRYHMIATQDGTTTVDWFNDDAPDDTGTGPTAPGGVLTNIRTLEVLNYDKPFVEEGGESWRNLNSTLMPGTLLAQYNFDGDHNDSSGNALHFSPEATPVAPTGQINIPASGAGGVGLGSFLYINDGYNGEVRFTILNSAGTPTSHDRVVQVSAGLSETQAQLTTLWYNEILASPLDITPTDNGTNVSLVNTRADTDANRTINNGISGISVSGMSGGVGKIPRYPVRQGIQGWETLEGVDQDYSRASNDASLTLTGAMSIWAIVRIDTYPTGEARIVSFIESGETEANNALYSLYLSPGFSQLRYFCEHEGGLDSILLGELTLEVGKMSLVSLSRSATGEVTLFLNGVSSGVHAMAVPTGGTGSRLQLSDNSSLLTGFYGGLAITDGEHDLNDHLAMYDYVRNL